MNVKITYPSWGNLPGLWDMIADIVFREGGDGWCWIKCNDPKKMFSDFISHLNSKYNKQFTIVNDTEGLESDDYIVLSPYSREEHWLFSNKDCNNNFYEMIVELD